MGTKLAVFALSLALASPWASASNRVDELLSNDNIKEILAWAPRYEHGEGVKKSPYNAIRLYCWAAIKHKNPNAMRQLGWIYANGRGVARNDDQASAWLSEASNRGCGVSKRLSKLIVGAAEKPACVLPDPPESAVDDQELLAIYRPSDAPTDFSVLDANNLDRKDIYRLAEAYGHQKRVDPKLIKAVIKVESDFNSAAVSSKGAAGLMQLMPATAKRFRVSDPFNPSQNIRGGVDYLRWLLDEFDNDLVLAIASYFAGENAIKKHGGIPKNYPKTRNYVQRVIQIYSNNKAM